jgi:uncharacterized protein YbjT (DUF2867 family)
MDVELAGSGAAYRALSLPFYMENLLGQLDAMRGQGALHLTCAGDRPLATIATRDIAEAAAGLLTERTWTGQDNLPLFGPDRLTSEGMAEVISDELEFPVAYRRITVGDLAASLRARGANDQMVKDMTEMMRAQDEGIYDADWVRAEITGTAFRTWCREVLKPAAAALIGQAGGPGDPGNRGLQEPATFVRS